MGLVRRVCRLAFSFRDMDILDPSSSMSPTTAGVQVVPSSSSNVPAGPKKVKVAQIADQLDDTELELIDKKVSDQAYQNYRAMVGADPPVDAEPTPEQITVLYNKIITRGDALYADFSVLTPLGRRVQKQLKAKDYFLQEDGSWKQVEMPGPPTFQAWTACWKIYKVAVLMFKYPAKVARADEKSIMTPAALKEYYENIQKLSGDYPECWHLVMQAEDRCRGEHLERVYRKLMRARLEGRLPMSLDFNVDHRLVL